MGSDDTAEFQVAGGRSLDVTFEPLPGTLVHDSSIQSTVVDRPNNRVIYVDPTGFTSAAFWIDGISRSIFNTVESANNGSPASSSTNAYFLQSGTQSPVGETATRFWASGFVNIVKQRASGVNGELTSVDVGSIFGRSVQVDAKTRAGLFGGVSHSRIEVENDRQTIRATAGHIGGYANWTGDEFFGGVMLFAGLSEQNSKRDVANNLVAGGIETAKADYLAAFVAPAVTVGTEVAELASGSPLIGSLRVNYAGMWLNGYSETGVTNPVTIKDRYIHRFGARAQLSFQNEVITSSGSVLQVKPRMGVDYAFSAGSSKVSGTVAGLPLNFTAEPDDDGPAAFLGADFNWTRPGSNHEFKLGSELRFASQGFLDLSTQLSFKVRF